MSVDPTEIVKSAAKVVSSETVKGSLSDAWQALLGDRIAAWRLVNAAKTQVKVQAEFAKLDLKPNINRIPERFAITWFEEASKQDEDEIQDIFARLLAQAAAINSDALDRRNLEIITRLTPNDAALFSELAEGGWGGRRVAATYFWGEDTPFLSHQATTVDLSLFNRSFEHLITLGILARTTLAAERTNSRSLRSGPRIQTVVKNVVYLTETGKSIYRAVTGQDAIPKSSSIDVIDDDPN